METMLARALLTIASHRIASHDTTPVQARMLLTSTSEVYGDPQISPQKEDYWGHVNPIGPRACYDEGE